MREEERIVREKLGMPVPPREEPKEEPEKAIKKKPRKAATKKPKKTTREKEIRKTSELLKTYGDPRTPGTLHEGEPHPSAHGARAFLLAVKEKLPMYQETFSSVAMEGNRLASICSETLRRFTSGKPVSDRYLLGLAWYIRDMEDFGGVGKKDEQEANERNNNNRKN